MVALLVSFAIVALMMYGVVQGLVEVCGYFELLFVNVLGMPYNSGVFAYVIIVAGVLICLSGKPCATRSIRHA